MTTTNSLRTARVEVTRTLPTNWVQTGFSPLWLVLQAGLAVAKRLKALRANRNSDGWFQTNFHPANFVSVQPETRK